MVNTFTGFQKKVEESFHRESLIAGRFSPDYTFSGVKTVKVITPTTVAMTTIPEAAPTATERPPSCRTPCRS